MNKFKITIDKLDVQKSASGTINGILWSARIRKTTSHLKGFYDITFMNAPDNWQDVKAARAQIGAAISKSEKAIALEKARSLNV